MSHIIDTPHVLSNKKKSPISNADSVRHKLAAPLLSDTRTTLTVHSSSLTNLSTDSEVMYSPESTPESTPEPHSDSHRKRKRKHTHSGTHSKRHKRASVDTKTISVTRLPGPTPIIQDTTKVSVSELSMSTNVQGLNSVSENSMDITPVTNGEPRPRSLRISLSIQDDTESGVVRIKTPRVTQNSTPPQSYVSNDLPNWEDISHKAQSSTDIINDVQSSSKSIFPTVVHKTSEDSVPKKRKLSVISQAGKNSDKPSDSHSTPVLSIKNIITPRTEIASPSAFTASPLPSSSPPDFKTIDDVFEIAATTSSAPSYTSTGVTQMNVSLSRPLFKTVTSPIRKSQEMKSPIVSPTINISRSKPASPIQNNDNSTLNVASTPIEELTTTTIPSSSLPLSKPIGTPVVSGPPPTGQSVVIAQRLRPVSSQPHTTPSVLSSPPQPGHTLTTQTLLTKTDVVDQQHKTPDVVPVSRPEDNITPLTDKHHAGVITPPIKEPNVTNTDSPVEHLVSDTMSSPVAMTVTNINTVDKTITTSASHATVARRPPTPIDDVIITSVETNQSRGPLPAKTPINELLGIRPVVPSQQMRKVTGKTIVSVIHVCVCV